jgi:hypothetical protein
VDGVQGDLVMATRVFDRRGRDNWSEEKRRTEDKRVRERRSKKDRRVAERRQDMPWPDGRENVNRRREDRRKMNRRGLIDSAQTKQGSPSLSLESTLLDGFMALAKQQSGFVVIKNPESLVVGTLSERDAVRAVADGGGDVLSSPLSKYITKLN